MITLRLPRLLLIAGNGRDSGKTTLAFSIIHKFSNILPLVAIKISPHQHKFEPGGNIIVNEDQLYIVEENDPATGKDSSRMLSAGAYKSYFIMASDDQLTKVMYKIIGITGQDAYLIAESGGLRRWVEPGLFFIVNRNGQGEIKTGTREITKTEHTWITFDGQKPDFDINRIGIQDKAWILQQHYDNI